MLQLPSRCFFLFALGTHLCCYVLGELMGSTNRKLDADVTAAIRKAVGRDFTNDSRLVELGIDSLAAVRLILTLIPESDSEIDLSDLVDLRTVGQFRHWIEQQVAL